MRKTEALFIKLKINRKQLKTGGEIRSFKKSAKIHKYAMQVFAKKQTWKNSVFDFFNDA